MTELQVCVMGLYQEEKSTKWRLYQRTKGWAGFLITKVTNSSVDMMTSQGCWTSWHTQHPPKLTVITDRSVFVQLNLCTIIEQSIKIHYTALYLDIHIHSAGRPATCTRPGFHDLSLHTHNLHANRTSYKTMCWLITGGKTHNCDCVHSHSFVIS